MTSTRAAPARREYGLRAAGIEDLVNLQHLLTVMHAEIGLYAIDWPKFAAEVRDVVENGRAVLLIYDGAIVGSIGLHVGSQWYSSDPLVTDKWLFIDEEHRSFETLRLLLDGAHEYRREIGLPPERLVIAIYGVKDTRRKMTAFGRMAEQVMIAYRGMEPLGGEFTPHAKD